MDARMILAGRGINPVAAFNDADIASQNALATNQAYAMRDYYRQNGAQVLAGNQNALAGLAQIGPLGAQQAFDARANIQAEQTNSFNLEQAKIEAAQQTEAHLAKMSADQIKQEADNLRRLAETAALAKDPMQWDNTFRGTPYEGTWDKRDAVLAILGTQKEVLDRISPPAPKPEDEYGRYVQEETAAGRTPLSRIDFAKAKSPTLSVETLPDGTTRVAQGIGAGDKALKAADAATVSSDTVLTAAKTARDLAGLTSTGVLGAGISYNPQSNAAELRRQVDVLKSVASISTLTAMRQASPTGGALGAVSDKENAMLAAAAGALDPNAGPEQFRAQLDNYERTLLRIIHGNADGDRIFNETRAGGDQGSQDTRSEADILGEYGLTP